MTAKGTITVPIVAGLVTRGQIRTHLACSGLEFDEVKGWLESVFRVRCNERQARVIVKWIDSINSEGNG